MSQEQNERLERMGEAMQKLPESKQAYLLGYAEAIADLSEEQEQAG